MPSTDSEVDEAFPRCAAELTVDWLSRVLDLPVAGFDAVNIGDGKGMLGDVWRLHLEMLERAPMEIVAKFPAARESNLSVRKRSEIFAREINFYRTIAPLLRCRLPKIYGSWYDQHRAEFLILMEHVRSNSAVSQTNGVSFDQAVHVMLQLAALHSFGEERFPDLTGVESVDIPQRRENQRMFIRNGWESLKELIPDASAGMPDTSCLESSMESAYVRLASLPMVLCHGDVRPDNLIFSRDEDKVVLIDWQGVAFGPRCWDVTYFLAQGLRVDDRRSWQDKLIDVYVEASLKSGLPIDRSLIVDNVGSAAWYSFAVACSLFTVADTNNPQTLELARSMGERAINFLRDEHQL